MTTSVDVGGNETEVAQCHGTPFRRLSSSVCDKKQDAAVQLQGSCPVLEVLLGQLLGLLDTTLNSSYCGLLEFIGAGLGLVSQRLFTSTPATTM